MKHSTAIESSFQSGVRAPIVISLHECDAPSRKTEIIDQALTELKIHAFLEEEVFYASVRAHVGRDIMNEADEEHHVAKVLIA